MFYKFGYFTISGDVDNDEELRVLEDEIMELQEYNAKVESEMIKLRTDISQMEQHIRITERVTIFI